MMSILPLLLGLLLMPQQPTELSCHANGALPDAACTPGATDPRVTQENIHQTICVAGYSTSVRPPARVTNAWKANVMRWYGVADQPSADYEGDHLIPIEIGGDPGAAFEQNTWMPTHWMQNYWPQPWLTISEDGAHRKDRIENHLHALVCRDAIPLATAQTAIASNWLAAYATYLGPLEPMEFEDTEPR